MSPSAFPQVGADAVCHGATGKGNDQVRFELGYYALKPDIKCIAPWREWDLNSRTKLLAYAEANGIPVPASKRSEVTPLPRSSLRRLLGVRSQQCPGRDALGAPMAVSATACGPGHPRNAPVMHRLPLPRPQPPFSMDANLLHISYEGNALEDPWEEPPADMFLRTVAPEVPVCCL